MPTGRYISNNIDNKFSSPNNGVNTLYDFGQGPYQWSSCSCSINQGPGLNGYETP